jgi:predicted DNA-binding protein with PD1-like motif
MKYSSGTVGRIFTLRFEENDPIYKEIESLCDKEGIDTGCVWLVGGVKNGGVVVGPKDDSEIPLIPVEKQFTESHEIIGFGTLFRNEQKVMKLHMHAGMGRGDDIIVGCPRQGLESWLVTEGILLEMKNIDGKRIKDHNGFELLTIGC